MAQMIEERRPLREVLADRWKDIGKFEVKPQYVASGDFVSLFFTNEKAIAERVDDVLTIFRSDDTSEIVGCKIKGVSLLAKKVST